MNKYLFEFTGVVNKIKFNGKDNINEKIYYSHSSPLAIS